MTTANNTQQVSMNDFIDLALEKLQKEEPLVYCLLMTVINNKVVNKIISDPNIQTAMEDVFNQYGEDIQIAYANHLKKTTASGGDSSSNDDVKAAKKALKKAKQAVKEAKLDSSAQKSKAAAEKLNIGF